MEESIKDKIGKTLFYSGAENSEPTFQGMNDTSKNAQDSLSWVYHVNNKLLFAIL